MNLTKKITLEQAKAIRGGGSSVWAAAIGFTMVSSVLLGIGNSISSKMHAQPTGEDEYSSTGSVSSNSSIRIRLSKYPSKTFVTFNTPF